MTALYVLTQQQKSLEAQLEASGFDELTIADTLEGEGDELKEKRLGYIAIIKQKRSMAEERAKVAKAISDLSQADVDTANRLEKALLQSLTATNDKEIVGVQFEARVRKNPPSVEVIDPLSLATKYWRLPKPTPPQPTPDKDRIKLALQAGEDVIGARLVTNTRLEIK